MKVGDIIPMNVDEFVEAQIDGVPVLACRYGMHDGQYALKIDRFLASSRPRIEQPESTMSDETENTEDEVSMDDLGCRHGRAGLRGGRPTRHRRHRQPCSNSSAPWLPAAAPW